MAAESAFYGSATVGAKGQIVIPAEARAAMQIEPGNKVVVVKGPREGSIIVSRVDSFDGLMAKIRERSEKPADDPTARGPEPTLEAAVCLLEPAVSQDRRSSRQALRG